MFKNMNVKSFTCLGVLIAMEIVLSRFLSVHTWNLKLSFSFIPIVVAAMIFGAAEAGVVGAIGDVIGAILFPVGTYFPGFTVTAFFTGVIYALFLKKKVSVLRTVLAVLFVQLVGSQFLNTYWISVLYSSPFWPLFFTRTYQTVVMAVVQVVVILGMNYRLVPAVKIVMHTAK